MSRLPSLQRLARVAVMAAGVSAGTANAQIIIGQTAPLYKEDHAAVRESRLGATLYFDAVNEQGGVHGQKLELVTIDDAGDAARASANVAALLNGWNAVALMLSRGADTSQAVARTLSRTPAALVGPSTGAYALRQPVHANVFHVRASYRQEMRYAAESMNRLGMKRIVVIQAASEFADDAVAGLADAKLSPPPVIERIDPARDNIQALVDRIAPQDPQVVFAIGDATLASSTLTAFRSAGVFAQFITLSNNATESFLEALGPKGRGVAITQVYPYERSAMSPLVQRAMDVGRQRGLRELTPSIMEGFTAAQVLVEGLRRAGKDASREKLIASLNGISRLNIGGMVISYSPTDHSGTSYTDLSVVSESGRLQR